ncbi:hypothetical protein TcCL_Unassigned04871 [Trypanosoma cruzi]|nr:hypothetical protein TcCL_Unassigned04871 [Trypanosoma cruzi]
MAAPNNAVALRKYGRVPFFPGANCAHSTFARCADSFPPTVTAARRVGEAAHGITTSAALRRTHAERPHRTLMTMSHLCRPRSHCFRSRKPFLCVFIGLLLQFHSARRVALSNPTTFAASCFIGRGRGMLLLCSLNRLEDGQSHFWALRQHPEYPRPALRHRYSLSGGSI